MLVFISYAHGDVDSSKLDRDWLSRIATYFRPVIREELFELWWDESVQPGEAWDSVVTSKLDEVSVSILLVSQRFLASDYIYKKEKPRLC